ncbi:MAG TPA: penicillin acylase family protein, partial [bacterium]|nr:penicillin acylase family protein [bacterium]
QISDMSTSDWHVILPAGQSGHPFSSHYRDQQSLWQAGEMITLNLHSLARRNPRWNWQTLRPISAISRP